MSLKNRYFLIVAMIFIGLFITTDIWAAVNQTNPESGFLNDITDRFKQTSSTWQTMISSAATYLFWSLVLISMIWTFGLMLLRKADIQEFFAEFIRFIIFTGFFWWLLQNGPQIASDIVKSLQTLAGRAGGGGTTPSGIMDTGFKILQLGASSFLATLFSPLERTVGQVITLICLIIVALVAINMMLLTISGWILAYAGVFLLGFGGSKWTSDIAINYFKSVISLAVQIMMLSLIVGIGQSFIEEYYIAVKGKSGISYKDLSVLLVVCSALLVLSNKVPTMVAGLVNSSSFNPNGVGALGGGSVLAAGGAVIGASQMINSILSEGKGGGLPGDPTAAIKEAMTEGLDDNSALNIIPNNNEISGNGDERSAFR